MVGEVAASAGARESPAWHVHGPNARMSPARSSAKVVELASPVGVATAPWIQV